MRESNKDNYAKRERAMRHTKGERKRREERERERERKGDSGRQRDREREREREIEREGNTNSGEKGGTRTSHHVQSFFSMQRWPEMHRPL